MWTLIMCRKTQHVLKLNILTRKLHRKCLQTNMYTGYFTSDNDDEHDGIENATHNTFPKS
jgi:hypothetical protein